MCSSEGPKKFRAALVLVKCRDTCVHGECGSASIVYRGSGAPREAEPPVKVSGRRIPPNYVLFSLLVFVHRYEFTIRICSLAIADQHLCIYTSAWIGCASQKITYVYK